MPHYEIVRHAVCDWCHKRIKPGEKVASYKGKAYHRNGVKGDGLGCISYAKDIVKY